LAGTNWTLVIGYWVIDWDLGLGHWDFNIDPFAFGSDFDYLLPPGENPAGSCFELSN
jgi:hypothetical protein